MFFIFMAALVLRAYFFDKGPEHSDFIIQVVHEVKAVLLAEPELAEVVVETFLGDSDHLCGLNEIDFEAVDSGFMEGSPLLDALNDFPDGALAVAFLLAALLLEVGLRYDFVPVVKYE